MKMKTDHVWLKTAAVVASLPLIAWPLLVAEKGGGAMVWGYGAVTAGYTVLAFACAKERPATAWLLVVMSLLTTAAIWML